MGFKRPLVRIQSLGPKTGVFDVKTPVFYYKKFELFTREATVKQRLKKTYNYKCHVKHKILLEKAV